jgi:hypothetical protein
MPGRTSGPEKSRPSSNWRWVGSPREDYHGGDNDQAGDADRVPSSKVTLPPGHSMGGTHRVGCIIGNRVGGWPNDDFLRPIDTSVGSAPPRELWPQLGTVGW